MFIFLGILLMGATTALEDTLVYPDLGVILEKAGAAILTDTEIQVSVIIKFQSLADTDSLSVEHAERLSECNRYSSGELANRTSEQERQFTSRTNELYSQIKLSQVGREASRYNSKRNILLPAIFAGSTLLNLAAAGWNHHKQKKAQKHIEENQEHIKAAYTAVAAEQKQIILLKNQVATWTQFTKNHLEEVQAELECEEFTNQLLLAKQLTFDTALEKIKNTLSPVLTGTNGGAITPSILTPRQLMFLTQHQADLKSTIYSQNPTLLYGLGTASILQIDLDNLRQPKSTHILLTAPFFSTNTLPTPVYRSLQTGTYDKEKCKYLNLPTLIFADSTQQWRHIKVDHCVKHNKLFACSHAATQLPSCIQASSSYCETFTTQCSDSCSILTVSGGALIRNSSSTNFHPWNKLTNNSYCNRHLNSLTTLTEIDGSSTDFVDMMISSKSFSIQPPKHTDWTDSTQSSDNNYLQSDKKISSVFRIMFYYSWGISMFLVTTFVIIHFRQRLTWILTAGWRLCCKCKQPNTIEVSNVSLSNEYEGPEYNSLT